MTNTLRSLDPPINTVPDGGPYAGRHQLRLFGEGGGKIAQRGPGQDPVDVDGAHGAERLDGTTGVARENDGHLALEGHELLEDACG